MTCATLSRSGGCERSALAVGKEPEASEAHEHHGPSGWFGNGPGNAYREASEGNERITRTPGRSIARPEEAIHGSAPVRRAGVENAVVFIKIIRGAAVTDTKRESKRIHAEVGRRRRKDDVVRGIVIAEPKDRLPVGSSGN